MVLGLALHQVQLMRLLLLRLVRKLVAVVKVVAAVVKVVAAAVKVVAAPAVNL